jgi:response regulator RpfG family c-di-GMP phosphodiesterase
LNNKVLLVDDSQEILDGLARLMRRDFSVSTASSGSEAIEKCRSEGPFAVVVSDYQMPGKTGLELLTQVREEWPSTQRILMTAHAELDVAVGATNDGEVFRFLMKPLLHDVLRSALAEGMTRHEQAETERRLAEELETTRTSLGTLTASLEGSNAERVALVRRISTLATRLTSADTLDDIARLTAASADEVLPGRGIRLELHVGAAVDGDAEVTVLAGPKLGGSVHREAVVTSDGPVGHFLVGSCNDRGEMLSDDDREIVRAISAFTGVAVHNQIRRRERDDAQHAVIFALARLAEARDNETGQHVARVSSYCALAAEALREGTPYSDQVDQDFINDLIRSAPLHDIGKVGIPDAILLKPGQLDPGEWEVMQTHAAIGADILSRIIERTCNPGYLLMALDIAWCHHEKWDGSGYPRHLSGESIPLASRILSVADCYDALTSRRPYKEAWDHRRAVDYLREVAGSQFDPIVIDAFLAGEAQANEIRVRLADDDE